MGSNEFYMDGLRLADEGIRAVGSIRCVFCFSDLGII